MLFLERAVWRKYPWLAVTSLDKMISPFTMVYGPLAVVFISLWEKNMFILVAFACYIIVTRIMKTLMYFTWSRPRPPANWFFYIGPFIVVQYWGAVIKLYALCTLKDRRWGNREVKVNAQNEIVRTGAFEDTAAEPQEHTVMTAAKQGPRAPIIPAGAIELGGNRLDGQLVMDDETKTPDSDNNDFNSGGGVEMSFAVAVIGQ